jgi:two-component system, OmpR family, phosphate regulon sensor histidine kinase PhoR
MTGSRARITLLTLAAIVVPALLAAGWLAITYGGAAQTLREDEIREARRRLGQLGAEVESRVAALDPARAAGAALVELDERGRPAGRFADVVAPPPPPVGDLERLALHLEAQGDWERAGAAFDKLRRDGARLSARSVLAQARVWREAGRGEAACALLESEAEARPGEWIDDLPFPLVAALLRDDGEAKESGAAGTPAVQRALLLEGPLPADRARPLLREARALGAHGAAFDALAQAVDWAARRAAARAELPAPGTVEWRAPAPDRVYAESDRVAVVRRDAARVVVVEPATVRRVFEEVAADFSGAAWSIAESRHETGDAAAALPFVGRFVTATAREPASRRVRQTAALLLFGAITSFVLGGAAALWLLRRQMALARLKSEFVDLVSHELRTPMAALGLRIEMLAKGDVPKPKEEAYVHGMAGEVGRVSAMVNRLLDFSRLERGRYVARRETIDLRRMIAAAVRECRPRLRERRQRLRLHVPRSPPKGWGDAEILGRALANLLDNASKYSPAGTPIDLGVSSGRRRLALEVADRGPGVDRQEARLIFEPFRRGKSARAGTVPGSGIGLALVAFAARAHGGAACVAARAGGGAVFRMELAWTPSS